MPATTKSAAQLLRLVLLVVGLSAVRTVLGLGLGPPATTVERRPGVALRLRRQGGRHGTVPVAATVPTDGAGKRRLQPCRPSLARRAALAAAVGWTFGRGGVAGPRATRADEGGEAGTSSPPPPQRELTAEEREEREQRRRDRRALVTAGRSTSSRQEIMDLSRQRAALVYNTTYQGASCIPGIPCL